MRLQYVCVKEGMSENEVAAQLEYLMRKNGASGTSFETIVAFGYIAFYLRV